jgi:hypothetical protein
VFGHILLTGGCGMSLFLNESRRAGHGSCSFIFAPGGVVMDSMQQNAIRQPVAEVVEACGEWFVPVIKDDEEITRTFVLKSFALGLHRTTPRTSRLRQDL